MGNAQPKYDLNDLQSDLDHLGHLIDTIADTMIEGVEYVAPGDKTGARLPGMDRVNALIWLARDHCAMINEVLGKRYWEIGSTNNTPKPDGEKIDIPAVAVSGGTVVQTSLALYCPTIDLSQISMREAYQLAAVLAAASTLLNAAIPNQGSRPVAKYLDNLQALLNEDRGNIAEIIERTRPGAPGEQGARSWLLAHYRLDCAEGVMVVDGASNAGFDDEFSRELLRARVAS